MTEIRKQYELTYPQYRIWKMDKVNDDFATNFIGGSMRFPFEVDVNKLKEAINYVIKYNDSLRLCISKKESKVIQFILGYEKEDIDFFDFSKEEDVSGTVLKWKQEVFCKITYLEEEKLYYFAIYKEATNNFNVLLKIHHIIADGWSIGLIQRQLCKIYENLINGEKWDYMLEESFSYLDYINDEKEYLHSNKFRENEKFWLERYADIPDEMLYYSDASTKSKRIERILNEKDEATIMEICNRYKCSVNVLFISIVLLYYYKMEGKTDIIIGAPIHHRKGYKQKKTVGMFTSTIAMRFSIYPESTIGEFISYINHMVRIYIKNESYPYDLLMEHLKVSRKGFNNLYSIFINYYNARFESQVNGKNIEVDEIFSEYQSHGLQLMIKDNGMQGIEICFDYKMSEYQENEIVNLYIYLKKIMYQIVNCKSSNKLNEFNLLENEWVKKIEKINDTSTEYPFEDVCKEFEAIANVHKNKIAIEGDNIILSYDQLNKKINQLAHFLKLNGLKRGNKVAIIGSNNLEIIICIFAVLKTLATFIPIDKEVPLKRIEDILDDSECDLVLVDSELKIDSNVKIINVNSIDTSTYMDSNLCMYGDPYDLAYIIYTSGSTGKPKGVMISRKALANYIGWACKKYFVKNEVMPFYSSISFDLTITSIFAPLLSGNKIITYVKGEDDFILYKILEEKKSTIIKLTPAHLSLLVGNDNTKSGIKSLIVGGENLLVSLAKRAKRSFGDNVKIYNEYGPTEATVGCMIYEYQEEEDVGDSVPIGYPIDNMKVYVLNHELEYALPEKKGELYIAGAGLACGYLRRDKETENSFIVNPHNTNEKMYKTGDEARYLTDGKIEYISRKDNQVKIRGNRVELKEIEACILKHDLVKHTVVVCEEATKGRKVLVAYIVRRGEIEENVIRTWLQDYLPNYMIPIIHFVDEIPLTNNGKVNYRMLANNRAINSNLTNTPGEKEMLFMNILKSVLEIETISLEDNYYYLGGDSITAILITTELRERGWRLHVNDLLNSSTIGEVMDLIECEEDKRKAKTCQGVIEKLPMIEWFAKWNMKKPGSYNQFFIVDFKCKWDQKEIKDALSNLILKHDELRCYFDLSQKRLYYGEVNIEEIFSIEETRQSYDILIQSLKNKGSIGVREFDLGKGPLIHLSVLNTSDNKQVCVFEIHHLIVDAISWEILLEDFAELITHKSEKELFFKTSSLQEWAFALEEYGKQEMENEIKYWTNIMQYKMNNFEDFNTGQDTFKTVQFTERRYDSDKLSTLLEGGKKKYDLKVFEILIIGIAFATRQLSKQDQIILEIEENGRKEIDKTCDISRTIGWFTSLYPMVFGFNGKNSKEQIKNLKDQIRKVPNKGFNYSIIRYLKQNEEAVNQKYIRVNYLGNIDKISAKLLKFKNCELIDFGLNSHESNELTALIDINIFIKNSNLQMEFVYSSNKYNQLTIKNFADAIIYSLDEISRICNEDCMREYTLSDFDIEGLLDDDLQQILREV